MAEHSLVCTIFFLASCLSQYNQFFGVLAIIQIRAGSDANACADPAGWGNGA